MMSHASTESSSSPMVRTTCPLATSHIKTVPESPARPPPINRIDPFLLNRSTCGFPPGKGITPLSSKVFASNKTTCFGAAMATMGDHGLTAMARMGDLRFVHSCGSNDNRGSAGATSGRALGLAETSVRSALGLRFFALLSEFSKAP